MRVLGLEESGKIYRDLRVIVFDISEFKVTTDTRLLRISEKRPGLLSLHNLHDTFKEAPKPY